MRAKGRKWTQVDSSGLWRRWTLAGSRRRQKKLGIDPGGTTNRNNAIATKVSPKAATGFMMNSSN
jgi:hypothetical protein